jgi:uncharacterized membrane protein
MTSMMLDSLFGSFADAHGTHRLLDSGGTITTIGVPGCECASTANGINNAGQIVGSACVGGLLYKAGQFTSILIPGAFRSAPWINDGGQIVGSAKYVVNNQAVFRGFLDDAGLFTTTGIPNSTSCAANQY